MKLHKLEALLRAAARPREFVDRLLAIAEGHLLGAPVDRGYYDPIRFSELPANLERLGIHLRMQDGERALAMIESAVRTRVAQAPGHGTLPAVFDADLALARTCYLLCRAQRPDVVVETGVSRGVTSAFILAALEKNGRGRLISIDLPPLGAAAEVGAAVPPELLHRWTLRLGSSRMLLGSVCREHGPVNLFIHDSLHTYRTMRWELRTVRAFLSPGALVLADDIENNRAFREWTRQPHVAAAMAVRALDKAGLFGVSRVRAA